MDRRSEIRLPADEPAVVTTLVSPPVSAPATVLNISGRGLCLQMDCPMPIGTPVQIVCADALYLGEIAWRQEGRLGVQVDQVLYGLQFWESRKRLFDEALTS